MDVLRAADYEVRPVAFAVGRALVERHHYARGGSNTATYMHGLFRTGEPACLGVAWWIPPTKSAALASVANDEWRSVLALSRLVLVPEVPQNGATYLLGRSVRAVRADARFGCLVTYADLWRGHTGHIYRAGGWEYVGLTRPEAVWVDETGRMVARKAGPRTRTVSEMRDLGYRCVGRFAKHKFRRVFPARR